MDCNTKNGIKFSLFAFISGIGLTVLAWLINCILKLCGLMLRSWVGNVFFAVMSIICIVFSAGVIYLLVKLFSKSIVRLWKAFILKTISIIGIAVVL